MANMSYCRFRNTEIDLQDCVDWLEESGFFVGQFAPDEETVVIDTQDVINEYFDIHVARFDAEKEAMSKNRLNK